MSEKNRTGAGYNPDRDEETGHFLPHEPTLQSREYVRSMAAYGAKQIEIARLLKITEPTLHKYYRFELDTAMIEANAKMAESLFKQGIGSEGRPPNVAATIFWLKTQAGWKEPKSDESDPDKGTTIIIKGGLPARD